MVDPKDPELRIAKLLDPGTNHLITERDKSGMLAARGKIKGNEVVVFASDPTVQGGALGPEGYLPRTRGAPSPNPRHPRPHHRDHRSARFSGPARAAGQPDLRRYRGRIRSAARACCPLARRR